MFNKHSRGRYDSSFGSIGPGFSWLQTILLFYPCVKACVSFIVFAIITEGKKSSHNYAGNAYKADDFCLRRYIGFFVIVRLTVDDFYRNCIGPIFNNLEGLC